MHRAIKPHPHHLRDAACIVAISVLFDHLFGAGGSFAGSYVHTPATRCRRSSAAQARTDAPASLVKLLPPQFIFCAATPAPDLRPLVWCTRYSGASRTGAQNHVV